MPVTGTRSGSVRHSTYEYQSSHTRLPPPATPTAANGHGDDEQQPDEQRDPAPHVDLKGQRAMS
ncbi:MAG: hypothetical protein DWI58_09240 [Chloroflexi bacterium]|nr:MAG: hypothetical protein DWI58_09240 [Chloroflexota bacterium]